MSWLKKSSSSGFEKFIEFNCCVVQRQGIKSARSILNYYNVESTSYMHALALVCFAAGMPRGSWEISAPCREDTSETHPAWCHLDCATENQVGEGWAGKTFQHGERKRGVARVVFQDFAHPAGAKTWLSEPFWGPWRTSVWAVWLVPGEAGIPWFQHFSKLKWQREV